MEMNKRGEWHYTWADIDMNRVRAAMQQARPYIHLAYGPHSPPPAQEGAATSALAGPRPSPNVGVPSTPEGRARRRSDALRAGREALAAAPRQVPATLHQYGPHDPDARRKTEMVYPTGVKWPTRFEDEISPKIQAQWAALNGRAHRQARERLLLDE